MPSGHVSSEVTLHSGKRGSAPPPRRGNGHIRPIAASLVFTVAFATLSDSFVALGSNLAIQKLRDQVNGVLGNNFLHVNEGRIIV